MTHGFIAVNKYNQVLVSSETKNLHFLSKASASSMLANGGDAFGGMKSWAYNFYSASTPVPFFTATADLTAIIGMKDLGNGNWQVDVLRSGSSLTAPVLYIFCDLKGRTTSQKMGVQVLMDDRTPSFDSRFSPLNVNRTFFNAPPSEPLAAGNLAALNFTPSGQTYVGSVTGVNGPIVAYTSLPQCVRLVDARWEESANDGQICILGSCWKVNPRTYYFRKLDWCFYRSGIRLVGNDLYCGWVAVRNGGLYSRQENSTNSLLDIVSLGNAGGTTSYGSSGTPPFNNETLNTQNFPIIVSSGSYYN